MTPRDSFHAAVREGLAPIVDFVFPPRCPGCGDRIGEQGGLCLACWEALVVPVEQGCGHGEELLPEGPRNLVCPACRPWQPRYGGVFAATAYDGVSRTLVLALKHGGRVSLAPMMARMMARHCPPVTAGLQRVFVPVPLHRWRLWRRGYNQAALLARELARLQGGKIATDALVRQRATAPLGGLGRAERARMLAGAIAAVPRRYRHLKGCDVVLVDDVVTSGATSNACVQALIAAGAARVTVACFARVADEDHFAKTEAPGTVTIPGAA